MELAPGRTGGKSMCIFTNHFIESWCSTVTPVLHPTPWGHLTPLAQSLCTPFP